MSTIDSIKRKGRERNMATSTSGTDREVAATEDVELSEQEIVIEYEGDEAEHTRHPHPRGGSPQVTAVAPARAAAEPVMGIPIATDNVYMDQYSDDDGDGRRERRPGEGGPSNSIFIQSSGGHGPGSRPQDFIIAPRADGSAAVLAVDPNSGASTIFVVPADSAGGDTLAQFGQIDPNDNHVPYVVPDHLVLRPGVDADVQVSWQMSRTIRIYAVADFIVSLLSMFAWVWFGLLAIFPVIGFVGALKYRLTPTVIFIVYFPLSIAARIYITYTEAERRDRESTDKVIMGIGIAFGILAVFLELYCMRLVILFLRQLRKIGQQHRDDLSQAHANLDERYSWW